MQLETLFAPFPPEIKSIYQGQASSDALRDGKLELAADLLARALKNCGEQKKIRAAIKCNIGTLCERMGDRTKAEQWFADGLIDEPRNPLLLSNLGNCAQWKGRHEEAIRLFSKALLIHPTLREAEFGKAISLLSLGKYAEGFRLYDSRLSNPEIKRLPVKCPRWIGQPLSGKTIGIIFEQGAGDTIQMLRYGPRLKAMGATVGLVCQRGLKPLAESMGCFDWVIEAHNADHAPEFPPMDFHVYTMSLPRWFGVPDTRSPYIPRLATGRDFDEPRIGICWAGSADHKHDRWRSAKLEDFSILKGWPAKFISLQAGPRILDLLETDFQIAEQLATNATYLETARLICSLDALISVDTSVVHLAGALGVPTKLLVATSPDWRWGTHGRANDWYDSVRVIRQSVEFQWQDVIKRAEKEIRFGEF